MPEVRRVGQVRAPSDAFRFGRNWQRYVSSSLNPTRERIARESLVELLSVDLQGMSFLDLGAGSGLFSLGAHRLGARRVVSVDVDPESVESCRRLRARAGNPESWEVVQGSILDPALLEAVEPADIVYSWGVLHHTGDMWRAIRNAANFVPAGGLFAVAIYNRAEGRVLDSELWLRVKRTYNHSPRLAQRAMELGFQAFWAVNELRHRRNPVRQAREYERQRGMARSTDLIDWLGGYPYEFASADEIRGFCEIVCGLRAEKVLPVPSEGIGNHQFVFRRPADLTERCYRRYDS